MIARICAIIERSWGYYGDRFLAITSDFSQRGGPPPALLARDWIAGLERGLAIIRAFDESHARLTAQQAGERTGLTRTAARRYLLTLTQLGYVSTDSKYFWLTPKVMRIGQAYLESTRLPRIVQPSLQRLTMSTQEISFVSVLDGYELVYVARNGQNRSMNTSFVLGARIPCHCSSSGMLLVAMQGPEAVEDWLATSNLNAFTAHTVTDPARLREETVRIREQGWAMSEQRLELDYRGVAVPLRDHKGQVVAALSVSMPFKYEKGQDAVARVLPVLKEVAQSLRHLL